MIMSPFPVSSFWDDKHSLKLSIDADLQDFKHLFVRVKLQMLLALEASGLKIC